MAEIRNIEEFKEEVDNIFCKFIEGVSTMLDISNRKELTYSSFISIFKYCGFDQKEDAKVGNYKKAIDILGKYTDDISFHLEWY